MTVPDNWSGVALNPNSHAHYTDHLAAVAVLMGIPLLFTEEDPCADALRCYPGLKAELHDWSQLNPKYFADRYRVFFISEMWNSTQLNARFSAGDNRYRVVHCPHGFSDKGYWFQECLDQDVTLVYGQNMLDLIRTRNASKEMNSYVLSGNLRYDYYLQNKAYCDQLVVKDVLERFARKQPLIIYAPTWSDREQSTSFYEAADVICANLPEDYNLLVKLHPNLELDSGIAAVYALMGKYQHRPNILFMQHFTPIYPLLSACDIYLGDRSAVGYDFLAFNRPMYFLNTRRRDSSSDRGVYIFRCGVEILPQDYEKLFQIIEKTLPDDTTRFGAIRQQVYEYSFVHRPWDVIRAEVLGATA